MSEKVQPIETDDIPERLRADLDRLREFSGKATPPPWSTNYPQGRDTQWLDVIAGEHEDEIVSAETQMLSSVVHASCVAANEAEIEQHKSNLEFIAEARNQVPTLLDEVSYLRHGNAELRSLLKELEWAAEDNYDAPSCPMCRGTKEGYGSGCLGHGKDCKLAAALNRSHGRALNPAELLKSR